ncbi:hypothetical protein A2U01_0108900, partial [Trifolium medium]|nr:hypothetical protein [Trifolium medium]
RLVDTITDPKLAWVGPEPRVIASVITPTAVGTHTEIEDLVKGQVKNWDVFFPVEGKRVCSEYSDSGFA